MAMASQTKCVPTCVTMFQDTGKLAQDAKTKQILRALSTSNYYYHSYYDHSDHF
jgi:hypothetical protein